MALAQIELKQGNSYVRGGKIYLKGQRITSTDAREIAWAKACGFMQVLDLEAAAREAERAHQAMLAAAKQAGLVLPPKGGKKPKASRVEEEAVPSEEELFPAADDELADGDE